MPHMPGMLTPKCVLNDLRFPAHDGSVTESKTTPAPPPPAPGTPQPLIVLAGDDAATCTDGMCG
jgi:hypothetical protein